MPRLSALCALLAAIAACLVWQAAAHAGHLHTYPARAIDLERDIAVQVGTCSNWKPLGSSAVAPSRLVGADATSSGNATVVGSVTLYQYLLDNCTAEYDAAVYLNINVTRQDGEPLAMVPLQGFTQTGSCASGGGVPYTIDPALGFIGSNQLFMSRYNTSETGTIHGTAPNHGVLRTAGTDGVQSFVVYYNSTGAAISCCDFVIPNAGANHTAPLAGKGEVCDDEAVDATIHGLTTGDTAKTGAHAGHNSDAGAAAAPSVGTATSAANGITAAAAAATVAFMAALLMA